MKVRIKKNDKYRALLSETIPQDVPLIFTNNWFYTKSKYLNRKSNVFRSFYSLIFQSKGVDSYFRPLQFAIAKDQSEFRYLAIAHPANQLKVIDFYEKYESLILYYCNDSENSLRRPSKIASKSFYNNRWENMKKLKISGAESDGDSGRFKHATSYFSYSTCTKLHTFFESEDFYRLEKKYLCFWSLDISKCFDSIYTHTIGWSTKNKEHSKIGDADNSFGRLFDRVISSCNQKETNGIIVGSEASRIFAEIVLQGIDRNVKNRLEKMKIRIGVDFDFRRYVDDYFLFGLSENILESVQEVLQEELREYKLFMNAEKAKRTKRPFITDVSVSKNKVSEILTDFYDFLLEESEGHIKPKANLSFRNRQKYRRSVLSDFKAASFENENAYSILSGYIISALLNKTLTMIEAQVEATEYVKYRDVFKLFLDVSFYLFNANPTPINSTRLCTLTYIVYRFFEQNYSEDASEINMYISHLIKEFFESSTFNGARFDARMYFPFEFINLLHISKVMGDEYLLSPKKVKDYFGLHEFKMHKGSEDFDLDGADYFKIVCVLFYISNYSEYDQIKKDIMNHIKYFLSDLTTIQVDAQKCFLFLDVVACPYLPESFKNDLVKKFIKQVDGSHQFKGVSYQDIYSEISSQEWFISWKTPDLWNMLEKRRILFEYS